MVKKKGEEHSDLTRLEDLSEFLHQKDSDLDSRFDTFTVNDSSDSTSTGLELDTLDDNEVLPDLPDFPEDADTENVEEVEAFNDEEKTFEDPLLEEMTFESSTDAYENEETSYDKTAFGENPFGASDSSPEEELEEVSFEENTEVAAEAEAEAAEAAAVEEVENIHHQSDDVSLETDHLPTTETEVYTDTSEKFEDVKTFAQNFSYGKASQGAGNPPFTIIARNIKYQDDADNILEILNEFGLINDQNKKDTQKAIEFGALILPQISEYTAIVIAHKLRRFDLDLQVGLSDEIHPSKSGADNPRGLLKKDNLKQNKSESLNLSDINTPIKEIIVSTTSAISGYYVKNYIGVETTFTIVEEAELEKLHYVIRAEREQSELFDYSDSEISTEKIFQDYQKSFDLLYADLTMQLKHKAFTQNANALLGLTFQLSPMQFNRNHEHTNAYQITCSATLAIVVKENS